LSYTRILEAIISFLPENLYCVADCDADLLDGAGIEF